MQTLTVKCKLVLSKEHRDALDATMRAFAAACNDAIAVGRRLNTASNIRIHRVCYSDLKARHGLTANLAVRAIARAASILKIKERRNSTVRPTSIDYDARIFSFREADWTVSLSTVQGRIRVPLHIGDYQRTLLSSRKPTSAVVWKTRQGDYYIGIHINVETPPPEDEHGWIGVDLGIASIATLSDGTVFSGDQIERVRARYERTRRSLQRKGTRGAKRVLKRLSGRERRFQQSINHTISRRIVDRAIAEGKGVRLEDLSGIRKRVRARNKSQRRRIHRWAFHDLRTKIAYKCALAGVPFELIDPRYTSQRCPVCGHVEKANRKSQSEFVCRLCGLEANADVVGAINIALGGVVNRPEVALASVLTVLHGQNRNGSKSSYKPMTSVVGS